MSPTFPPLNDPAVLADPHPLLRRLREEDPVHWCEPIHGWVVTRYDDVCAAFRNPALSSRRTEALVASQLPPDRLDVAREFTRVISGMMLMKDGADHHRLRVLGNRGLPPSVLAALRPGIERVAEELLDRVAGRGGMDLVADLAAPLPATMIADLFGIPREDRARFQRWSDDMARFFGGTARDPERDARLANDGAVAMEAYFRDLMASRRGRPGNDLMTLFLAGQEAGKLTSDEVAQQCIVLLVGGHVTTIDQLSNLVHALLEHPDQWRLLLEDPGLVKQAVEESLRYEPAVPVVHRLATEDVEIGGRTVRRGQLVYLSMQAANRDPSRFPEPDRFDITRTDNPHLAFAGGPHVCLGAGLARAELAVGLSALLRRFPGLRLDPTAPAVRRCESMMFRGFASLPVRFSVAAAA